MSKVNVHTQILGLNWKLIGLISDIDRFDAAWQAIERKEGQTLKELKYIATVSSVGASTRIEGSKLSDQEVDVLLRNMDISKLEDRDQQEVVGYFEVLDAIDESHQYMNISETELKNLHNQLLRYSEKDKWHKGNYKQHTNSVEMTLPDGSKQIIFQTTPPGFATEDAMRALIDWYESDKDTHSLVKSALFCYEFLSIHPFQDGNGRLSRLLATLLLRKNGYQWIRYVSFEHEIESKKTEYYGVLRSCQALRPNEDISAWVSFFLESLKNIQEALMRKLESRNVIQSLSPKDKILIAIIESNPGIKTGDLAVKTGSSGSTIKRMVEKLIKQKLIERHGVGPGSYYTLL
ncbi:winged helix-turn-helix transcriptional regulator [Pedobacter petrophilus]|uniref:Winged helix-turn-helix transcriptional regulator n=1 Tax=Pedobacter petrophilus TaxID=1908241 RepID=A0A7K0FXW4_9SPHI|nr:Fic family protein [Pedobacter petrophilus]MRX76365.1 winged helix-turn-helix transcriptional regulator [Pedobacter petrophilus]